MPARQAEAAGVARVARLGRRRGRFRGSRLRRRYRRRRNVLHDRRLRRRRRRGRLLRLRRRGCCRSRLFATRLFGTLLRLGLVVSDDTPDRRQNLLHGGLLDLCRLRHLRLHIINACVLHQARGDLPVPEMQARIFITQARLVPRSSAARRVTRVPPLPRPSKRRRSRTQSYGANRSAATGKGMSPQQKFASNAPRK